MSADLTTRIGSIELPNPVMTASGCAGHGDELGRYFPLSELGAIVVKSLAAYEWSGNPAPRLHPVTGGMLNSVGLQGPGVAAWLRDDLPRLERAGARVVASIWGRSVDDYEQAAKQLSTASRCVVAVEVNLSCPNLDGGAHLFAHSPQATADALGAARACERPVWAKLSPNTDQLIAVARAARDGRRRRGHPGQHRVRDGHRRRATPARARREAGEACRGAPSTRWPFVPSTTCTPLSPTCRSSASAAWRPPPTRSS